MAGSIGLSLTQRLDNASLEPLDGGTITFYAAGTTTPQNAYQDVSLTIPWANPLTLDNGNVPQLFFADGYIKFRIANAAGVTQLAADNVLVIGPSAGAGAAPSVDASTILSTGDLKIRYGTGAHTGWVRAAGRTVGSATSGATERANADCEDLFLYLYGADANLAVSGGRGADAATDWAANKTIALPDWRGRALAGLDDMGNSAAGRLTATYFGTAATALGAAGGAESKTFLQANLPSVNFVVASGQTVSVTASNYGFGPDGAGSNSISVNTANSSSAALVSTGTVTSTGTASSGGSGTPLAIASPMMLATIYIKL
jgi:microcystin-dependent protein